MTAHVPSGERRPVPALGAFLEGWRRVLRAPAVLAGMFFFVTVVSRLVAAAMATSPEVRAITFPTGSAAWLVTLEMQLRNLVNAVAPEVSPFFQPETLPTAFVASLIVNTAMWMFLTGGILDRLARARPIGTAAFFGACGVFFFRFLRLAAIVAAVSWPIWMVQRASEGNLVVRGLVLLTVAVISVLWDFAKVRAVVEDRHSMISAFTAAIRFVRRRAWRVLLLALLNGLAILAVLRIEFQILLTPAEGLMSAALSIGWLLLAVATRLAFLSSEVVFFQGELAHAGYTAAPLLIWPDSPSIEAMENLRKRSGQ
jgi:hypothetical protein